jgi:XapX domain-containing protein
MDILLSLIAGMILGVGFALLRLPIPAPITLAGVLGVVGVWAGFMIVQRFIS